jgi:hypothetical protein
MSATLDRPRRKAVELRELEELWAAPAARGSRTPVVSSLSPWLVRALVLSWAAVLVVVLGLAPAANPEAATPLWADLTLTAWSVALLTGAILGRMGYGRAGLAGSGISAGCGVVLGYACRATEHHVGSWWLFETAAFAGLALLSIACLAARRGRAQRLT